jgi:hypothetical protein
LLLSAQRLKAAGFVARYNKDDAWEGRRDAFTRVNDHIAVLIGARAGAAVRCGAEASPKNFTAF